MIPEIKVQISEIKSRDTFTEKIIACAYKVHRELGPGFQEKIYHKAMKVALGEAKLSYETEKLYKVGLLINFGNKSCQVRRLMI